MSGCIALIVAAGRGTRLGGSCPKQYRALAGAPVLRHSVVAFLDHPRVTAVRVVIHPDDRAAHDDALRGLDAVLAPVPGGAQRQDSCRLGLESLIAHAPGTVLIHDAARPFVGAAIVDRVCDALTHHSGAVAALPVIDTLKRAGDDAAAPVIAETVGRDALWRAQTPQGFRFDDILAAHRAAAGASLTDDAAVAERAGLDVALVLGSEDNFKVTTEDDLVRAERYLAAAAPAVETRSGLGVDVHAFGPGDHVMLCGVKVPHSHGLVGHSDADVGLHAVTDALLGAIGAGDIGTHFPPDEMRWKGADSAVFLRHAGALVVAAGGRIVNLDLTVICEAPRLKPHGADMVARIGEILDLSPGRVSVKATTTERLGFTGRSEGIAAQAIATVSLPARV